MKKAIYKVPGGKLLKIFLEDENNVIKNIKITGDFFVHPEEAVEYLEKKLVDVLLAEEELTRVISEFISENNLTLFGFDTTSLVKTILTAK